MFTLTLLLSFTLSIANNRYIVGPYPENEQSDAQKEWALLTSTYSPKNTCDIIHYVPYGEIVYIANCNLSNGKNYQWVLPYIKNQAILSYLVAAPLYYLCNPIKINFTRELNQKDRDALRCFIHSKEFKSGPNKNLILILIESLESWVIEKDIDGVDVMPFLRQMTTHSNVMFADKVKSQALGGCSGDGQMTINTGFLPLSDGVACMHYSSNIYPNFANLFRNSFIVNPWPHIWNQDTMAVRYSYQRIIEPEGVQWQDEQVFENALNSLNNMDTTFCSMILTVSSHSPFTRVDNKDVSFNADVPKMIANYLKCLNYTDRCLKSFVSAILSESNLSNSAIVITGDHTIFKPSMLLEFHDFAESRQLSIEDGINFCPLIIYSPDIKENKRITDVCYQMDIFPTILATIGVKDYYWRGFGIDLNRVSGQERYISENQAFYYSDMIIRSDYFRQYIDDINSNSSIQ